MYLHPTSIFLFFFNDTATTEIYTLSLHDALPISARPTVASRRSPPPTSSHSAPVAYSRPSALACSCRRSHGDRKSTRLNSSHITISYAVFCLKKKNTKQNTNYIQVKTSNNNNPNL